MVAITIYQEEILLTKCLAAEGRCVLAENPETGEMEKQPPTPEQKTRGTIITVVYSCVVVVFGNLYKLLAVVKTNEENHRYQKTYDDALITKLFIVNFVNFYMPLMFIAVDKRNTANYEELFKLLLTQLAAK